MRAFATLLLAAAFGPASAAVVNFDTYSPRYFFEDTTIVTDGFSFTSTCKCMGVDDQRPLALDLTPLPGAYNGTASLIYSTDPLTIAADGGGAFFLDQFDLGLSWYVPDADVGRIATVAYALAGGGTGSLDVALGRSYSTVTVGQDVLSVTISGGRTFGYVSLDNLVVNNRVPEPASVGLALLALCSAGLATRRRHPGA